MEPIVIFPSPTGVPGIQVVPQRMMIGSGVQLTLIDGEYTKRIIGDIVLRSVGDLQQVKSKDLVELGPDIQPGGD